MSEVYISLPDYLRAPCPHLWRWQDNGDALVWCADPVTDAEESTAAFAAQLHLILGELNERLGGLPPLICVLSVIDLCSTRWSLDDCSTRLARLVKESRRGGRRGDRLDPAAGHAGEIAKWFSTVWLLPIELRGDPQSQVDILTYALQDAPAALFEAAGVQAADVLECISIAAGDRDLRWASSASPTKSFARAKLSIDALLYMASRPIDAESLQLWSRTGVSGLPKTEPVEDLPEPRCPIAGAMRQLAEDSQWGRMARVAASVASLLSLPRRPSDPEALPVGGVSDVTNRGQPERLLMTELAQEPMALLARIANGQALYLRRETPPGPSPKFRPVLIESGIRTWGENRLQIAAVALAIAAAEERRGETSAKLIMVAGQRIVDEDFATPEGVIEHLSRLNSDEHPGAALESWVDDLDDSDESFADPVLIVTAATDRDPRFRRALDNLPGGSLIARVERDTTVTLLRRTPLGDEQLQRVSLDPVEAPPTRAAGNRSPDRQRQSGPALLLDVKPCPLRFSDHLNGSWMMASDEPGLFTITQDRRLVHFDSRWKGAVHLVDRVPSGRVLAHEVSHSQLALVIGDANQQHTLLEVELQSGDVRVISLLYGDGTSVDYEFDQGQLYRFGDQVQLFCRRSGACLAAEDLGFLRHIGGPMLYDGRSLHLVSQVANQIVRHEMPSPLPDYQIGLAARRGDDVIVLIGADGTQMAALDGSGSLQPIHTRGKTPWYRGQLPSMVYRSIDRNLVVMRWFHSTDFAIDLAQGTVSDSMLANPRQLLAAYDSEAGRLVQPRSLLSRFNGIRIVHGQTIVLMKSRRHWAIGYDSAADRLSLQNVIAQSPGEESYFFGRSQRVASPSGPTGWRLRTLAIGDHRVTADSRGLLHLKRGDDQTEVTLMLYEPHVSGWTSWGEQFGDSYFLTDGSPTTSSTVNSWLKEFARQCSQLS